MSKIDVAVGLYQQLCSLEMGAQPVDRRHKKMAIPAMGNRIEVIPIMAYYSSLTGGTTDGALTVPGRAGPPNRVPRFHQLESGRVSAARPAF